MHKACRFGFRAVCSEAANGGSSAYRHAGRKLPATIAYEQPTDVASGDWHNELQAKLTKLLNTRNDDAVLDWLEARFPKMMKLIPSRRRPQFLEGLREQYEQRGIEV